MVTVTNSSIKTAKTKVRIAFVVALLAAVLGAAGGLYWRAVLLFPADPSVAIDFLLKFAAFQAGDAAGLWQIGAGFGAEPAPMVRWAEAAYRRIGAEGWRAAIHAWHVVGWSAICGAAAGIGLLGAVSKNETKE